MTTRRTYITTGEKERLLAIAKKYGLDGEPKAQSRPYPKAQVDEKAKAEWRHYAAKNKR